jgi:arylformamidase
MKRIIDISWPLCSETTGYKDKKSVVFNHIKTFSNDGVRESSIELNSHAGTHVDAPTHFLSEGMSIDQISLGSVCGDAFILDMTMHTECITREALAVHDDQIVPGSTVLLKTLNSELAPTNVSFNPSFVYLEASGAQYLAEKKIKAVGIDYLGIERNQPGHPTHKALLNAGVAVIEGLRLGHVAEGNYFLVCLPLAVVGLEAAPARAVLLAD